MNTKVLLYSIISLSIILLLACTEVSSVGKATPAPSKSDCEEILENACKNIDLSEYNCPDEISMDTECGEVKCGWGSKCGEKQSCGSDHICHCLTNDGIYQQCGSDCEKTKDQCVDDCEPFGYPEGPLPSNVDACLDKCYDTWEQCLQDCDSKCRGK